MPKTPIDRVQFVCGFPRTGSTLLMNLLAQHPDHRVTATNGLCGLFAMTAEQWVRNDAFRAQGIEKVRPHIRSALQGMVTGFHAEALESVESTTQVFDKSRQWLHHIDLLQEVLGEKRVIVCIRDVRDVVASMEALYHKNPMTRGAMPDTTAGRVKNLLNAENGIVGRSIVAFRDAIRRGFSTVMVPVRYHELVENPQQTLHNLHLNLGLEPWDGYDPMNVQQRTQEDDMLLAGLQGLHDVQPQVEPGPRERWRGLIPDDLARVIDQQFSDIQSLVHGRA